MNGEAEEAGSAFGVPDSLPPGDGWVAGPAPCFVVIAELSKVRETDGAGTSHDDCDAREWGAPGIEQSC